VEAPSLARYRSRIVERLRHVLAGDAPLRDVLRLRAGLEDEAGKASDACGPLLRPTLTLALGEQFGANPDAALSAAVSIELVDRFLQIHSGATYRERQTGPDRWDEAQAINAGDLALSLALAEASRAGDEVLGWLVGAARQAIEARSHTASSDVSAPSPDDPAMGVEEEVESLFRCACELGAIVGGAPREAQIRLEEVGFHLDRALSEIGGTGPDLGELDAHLARAMRAWAELPESKKGTAWMQGLCDSIRATATPGGAR
jgi:geranylgeranyl diphosphate synthase type I